MAIDTENSPVLENTNQLLDAFEKGCKPKNEWRIGTEHEKFVFYRETHKPVPYDGDNGIRVFLEKLKERHKFKPVMDQGAIIGLKDHQGGAISLEPGGQLELSGAPLEDLHQTCAEAYNHLEQLREITDPMGIGFLGVGAAPEWSMDDMPRMPKSRYKIMEPYMGKVGRLGTTMMYRTTTVQVNLDFASEADMVQKLRVSLALQPVATALFANSPFLDGHPNGFLSFRSEVWRNTDNARTGMLPFVFEDGFGFERYSQYILDMPMYLIIREGRYIDASGRSFRDFLKGELDVLPGEKPTLADWEEHIGTAFPEVRLKSFLEMRGADGTLWQGICALPAFWVGLLYDQSALDAAWDLVKNWTAEERQALREQVPKFGLSTSFRDRKLIEVAREVVHIAQEGLKARARRSSDGSDETQYLEPLIDTLAFGNTPAERLLQAYETRWNKDLSHLYREQAF